jgi:phage terminase large subunit-like protein
MTSSKRSSLVDRFAGFCELVGFKLEPFQRLIVGELFAGRREMLIHLPRVNGKTTLLAALALHHLLSRPDGKVAIGAASREQASVLFDIARGLASHPAIAKRVDVTRREIRTQSGWMKVVASDGPKQHGLILTLAIVDELHAHRNDELYLALRTGLLKIPDAQLWTITTAGVGEESILGLLRARARKLPDIEREYGFTKATGPNFGMLEWALPEDADIDDMKVVKGVNPASWLTETSLAEQRDAVHDIAFRRYHGNQWLDAQAPWITGDVWDACKDKPDIPGDSEVVLGVDASIRHDSTVVARVRKVGDVYHAEFRVWQPTKGREVQMEDVMDYIRDESKKYRVKAVVYDPQFMHHAAQRLESEGMNMIEWRQDNARMVPATRTLHEAVTHGKLRHGGYAIARSHALAAEVVETERGVRIKKTASRDRIDAIVALAMAVEWASRDEKPRTSIYDERGLVAA